MSGYAISIDLSYNRMVQGPHPKEGDPDGSTYPDYSTETYLAFCDGPPPDVVRAAQTNQEASEIAVIESDRLLATAALRIAPLQDAVDMGKATPEKQELLKKWKEYRISVGDVKSQAGYPQNINWPDTPE